MTKYLIQNPNDATEQQFVDSLIGHDGWTVVQTVDEVPEYHTIQNGEVIPTVSDYQRDKRREVDAYLYGQCVVGYTPSNPALAGHTLQCRDDTDRTNWLGSLGEYQDEIAAGNGTTVGADFRTTDNSTILLSYEDAVIELKSMRAWVKALMQKSWAVKNQIDALTDMASVQAFDVAAAWEALP